MPLDTTAQDRAAPRAGALRRALLLVRALGRGMTNDGQPYENSYAWFMRMRNGKLVDGTAFFDSISFNDLWTRVEPR